MTLADLKALCARATPDLWARWNSGRGVDDDEMVIIDGLTDAARTWLPALIAVAEVGFRVNELAKQIAWGKVQPADRVTAALFDEFDTALAALWRVEEG